tara:strand:- start:285 stop:635 length:351 start_codon:yes stop_codon:yes gene_type:complete
MKIQDFLNKLKSDTANLVFKDTMAVVETNYSFFPTAFRNGEEMNGVGQNSGSCKVFAFAKINGFSKQQTLDCFGEYYVNDVLKNPKGIDHQNIRNFIIHGWEGILFEGNALVPNTQ